jgi:hypothetical protein
MTANTTGDNNRMKADDLQEKFRQQGFLARRLFAVFTTPRNGLAPVLQNLEAHLRYQVELEHKGLMFAAGPLLTDDGEYGEGEGMFVYRVASLAEARSIAQADPMHSSGARSFRIRPWILNEGKITISADFSTGKFEVV